VVGLSLLAASLANAVRGASAAQEAHG